MLRLHPELFRPTLDMRKTILLSTNRDSSGEIDKILYDILRKIAELCCSAQGKSISVDADEIVKFYEEFDLEVEKKKLKVFLESEVMQDALVACKSLPGVQESKNFQDYYRTDIDVRAVFINEDENGMPLEVFIDFDNDNKRLISLSVMDDFSNEVKRTHRLPVERAPELSVTACNASLFSYPPSYPSDDVENIPSSPLCRLFSITI